jgi:hypothetical protein
MIKRLLKIAFLISFLASGSASADWIQIFQHSKEKGQSWRLYLPALGNDYVPGVNYWVGSVRRVGTQVGEKLGGVFHHGASSYRVWAADSGVTLYLFEGDNFDGRMIRFHVKKGKTGAITNAGWFNDRLGSFIAVREKEGDTVLEKLVDTPIPLDDMVDSLRTAFSTKIKKAKQVEEHWLHDTQINYTTAHSYWTELGVATIPYWSKYYDLIRIKQEIEIDPKNWWWDYDTEIKLGYFFHVDSNKHLQFTSAGWGIWVESGKWSRKILKALESAVVGDIVAMGNQIRDAIADAVVATAGAASPLIWNNVKRVGWKIPCEEFNNQSGYGVPSKPFCWKAGGRKEMFPPTLILHHDSNDP